MRRSVKSFRHFALIRDNKFLQASLIKNNKGAYCIKKDIRKILQTERWLIIKETKTNNSRINIENFIYILVYLNIFT